MQVLLKLSYFSFIKVFLSFVLEAVSRKIEDLKSEKKNVFSTVKENTSAVETDSVLKYVELKNTSESMTEIALR